MEHLGDETLSRIKELGGCEFEVSKAWYLKGFSNTSEAAETRCMATLLRVLGEAGGNLGRGGNVKSRKNAQEASNQHSDLFRQLHHQRLLGRDQFQNPSHKPMPEASETSKNTGPGFSSSVANFSLLHKNL
jgi:hypothetical protein